MFNKPMLAIALLATGTAYAQPEIDMSGDAKNATPAKAAEPTPAASTAVFDKGTIGLSFNITLLQNIAKSVSLTAEGVPTINVLYFMNDKAALDLIGGFNLHHETIYDNSMPPVGKPTTIFGFALGAGYRMYKHRGERLHTFIEPQAVLTWDNVNDSNTVKLQGIGAFGAEAMFTEWASLSGWIGAGVTATNKFDDIQLATAANLAANLYWK